MKTSQSSSDDSAIYEWYVPFEDFSHFLRRDIQTHCPEIPFEELQVYIPGCGNSTLAEDLYKVGIHRITAVDFSPTIIKYMTERNAKLKLKGIVYKEVLRNCFCCLWGEIIGEVICLYLIVR
jgi:SAM-dependent methyltransferase